MTGPRVAATATAASLPVVVPLRDEPATAPGRVPRPFSRPADGWVTRRPSRSRRAATSHSVLQRAAATTHPRPPLAGTSGLMIDAVPKDERGDGRACRWDRPAPMVGVQRAERPERSRPERHSSRRRPHRRHMRKGILRCETCLPFSLRVNSGRRPLRFVGLESRLARRNHPDGGRVSKS